MGAKLTVLGGAAMCSGSPMKSAIQNLDTEFAKHPSQHFYGIQRGDPTIAKSPDDPKSNTCNWFGGDKSLPTSPVDFFKSHSYEPTGRVW